MPIEQISPNRVKLTGFHGKLELADGLIKLAELTAGEESAPYREAIRFRKRVIGKKEQPFYIRVKSVFHEGEQFPLSGLILKPEHVFILRPHHAALTAGAEVLLQTAQFLEHLIEQNRKAATEALLEGNQGSHLGNP